jgi:hypothetical protein
MLLPVLFLAFDSAVTHIFAFTTVAEVNCRIANLAVLRIDCYFI